MNKSTLRLTFSNDDEYIITRISSEGPAAVCIIEKEKFSYKVGISRRGRRRGSDNIMCTSRRNTNMDPVKVKLPLIRKRSKGKWKKRIL